ncbi:hypothetical protein OQA88_1405 [Cercophora sp. LCS_1]
MEPSNVIEQRDDITTPKGLRMEENPSARVAPIVRLDLDASEQRREPSTSTKTPESPRRLNNAVTGPTNLTQGRDGHRAATKLTNLMKGGDESCNAAKSTRLSEGSNPT